MSLIDALNWRYAVRAFSEQKLDDMQVLQLLEATSMSASSYGLQPYRILVVQNDGLREKLLKHSFGQNKVKDCSHLLVFAVTTKPVIGLVDEHFQRVSSIRDEAIDQYVGYANHMKSVLGGMNEQAQRQWAHEQAYIALGTLLTSAAMLRIDSCPMTGIDRQGFDQELDLARFQLTTSFICTLGHRHPDDLAASKAKVRVPLSDLVDWQ
ncbi:NAD(P)H-dependent oxidoreductase [Bowmanella denitrificans]|uniref:NAD(P)H-dependent oxidoreductase n=1 Tax=Bowmanella denitrificans TaxID=366582 RepID=UPI000C9C1FE7|nr:NAD(P)H-dependent oxidoreductase [Bowmanella denitrificans]